MAARSFSTTVRMSAAEVKKLGVIGAGQMVSIHSFQGHAPQLHSNTSLGSWNCIGCCSEGTGACNPCR